jgi:hypothetical protein
VTINEDAFDPKPNARTFAISTQGPPLAGWHVYLAARSSAAKSFGIPVRDGERVSTMTTLQDPAGETVVLQTALSHEMTTIDNVRGMRLVVEPPADQAIPTFSIDDVDGQILPSNQEYPALPTPVAVSGSVTLDGRGRAGRITFESIRDSTGGIQLPQPNQFSSVLSYRTVVDTDASGSYAVRLPPGKYNAYVAPRGSDSAKTTIPFVLGSTQLIQGGRALELGRKTHVTGRVVLGDMRPVGDAEVIFMPALQQPMGTNPLSLPRPALVRTNGDDATFAADVDPGVYDVTVAPLAGTRFPWVVQTSKMIPQATDALSSLKLDDVVVPPPIEQGGVVPGLTVRDPYGSAVAGAIIDVYAASQVSTTGTPLYLVFRTMTDANGHFDLHLAGAPK